MDQATFDRVGNQFVAYYDTVRGNVREQLTRNNLLRQLVANTELDILDVGGGDGRDAVWLAGQGHKVKVIDPSGVMLKKAGKAVNKAGFNHLVTLEQGSPEEVLSGIDNEYDLVLSHGVFMYLDDPQAHLNLLGRVVKPGGMVSVLTKGKAGSLLRLMHNREVSAAVELQETGHLINNLGENVLAVNEEAFNLMLKTARLSLYRSFGVRIATEFDYRPHTELPEAELVAIIDLETMLGSDEKTKGMGQMLHFICKPEGDKS